MHAGCVISNLANMLSAYALDPSHSLNICACRYLQRSSISTFDSVITMEDAPPIFANVSSQDAHTIWNQKYAGLKRITLQPGDMKPVTVGRYLGLGGFGSVHEARLGDVIVAIKTIWIRGKPNAHQLNEMELLEKMAAQRHRHVVEAIGCYVLPGRPLTELGLIIWPVAQYDLERLLSDLKILYEVQRLRLNDSSEWQPSEVETDVIEDLSVLVQQEWDKTMWQNMSNRLRLLESLVSKVRLRLRQVFGCLAQAVQYLHCDQEIRHKDLKPSQVLLSPDGLWLTDFGWSVDMAKLSNSATSHGDRTTARYHAPEREGMERCGRAEDVFGLGCIFVETAIVSSCVLVDVLSRAHKKQEWSFQANLSLVEDWLQSFSDELAGLRGLVRSMLAAEPTHRPSITDVVKSLYALECTDKDAGFFGSCCV